MKKLTLLVFFLITGFSAFAQTTYYSFQSGDLDGVDIWTTDPSGTLLIGSATPGAMDHIVILNGRTITISANNKKFASVTIQQGATLDIGTTTGHDFTIVTGRGTLRLESATIPAGNFTDFYSATGGTMEFSGSGTFNLPNLGIIRNLTISGTGVKVIANDLTLHQDLRINSGTLRIGNNNTARTVTINGDVYVESGAVWDIRNQNNPLHQVNLYGSLFNNGGTVDFINSALNYTGDPTNGSAVLNMLGTSNAQIVADGVIELNRLIINKGTDKTFVVHITSNTSGNFRLYGRNNQANGSTSSPYSPENPEIKKALWIRNGTLRLGFNVDIESLSEGGNDFFIPENAQLWVDGAEVYTTTTANGVENQGLTVYGTFRITDGLLDTRNSAGLIHRKSGVFLIEGGNCRASQFRRSGYSSATNFTSYIQTGGIVTVDGDGQNSSVVARFSIDKPESVFRMSGGTLRVSDNNGADIGGFDVKSDPTNASVTGGTVEITTNGGDFEFFSNVPVYNLNVIHGGDNFILRGNLVVKNDLTIGAGNTFLTNNYNISIGGNFTNNGTFTAGTSTITVNGSQNSKLSFNSVGTQEINNLTIAKDDASADTVFIINGATTPLRVTGEFRVESGVVDYKNFTLNARGNVYLASRVGLAGTTGQLLLDGTASQTITLPASGNGARVGRLRLNNAADFVLIGNTLTVDDELALDAGVFNIGIYGLNIYGTLTTASAFGVNEMIQTAGNASDGGLGLFINGNATYTFPIGVAGKYTPATAVITNYSDDGLLRINPVEGELQTLVRPDGNALTYYFRTRTADFTTSPDVYYTFTYNASDVPAGDNPDNDYVSGKVENTTRTSYGAAGDNVTANTFIIPTETLTQASYTAALASKFTDSVPIFYSRGNMNTPQNWNSASNWSNVSHTGPAASTPPTPGSIVQIGYGGTGNMHGAGGNTHWITINVNNINVAEVRFLWAPGRWRPRLLIQSNRTNIELGKVSGQGEMFIMNTATQSPDFNGDFGEFATEDVNNVFDYQLTTNGTITLPTNISVYPTLRLEAGTNNTQYNNRIFTSTIDLTVLGGLAIDWGATFRLNDAVGGGGDIEVFGNYSRLGDGGSSGRLLFPTTGESRTITFHGDLVLNTSGNRHNRIEVDNTTPNGLVHRLRVGGSIIQNSSNSYIDLFTNNTGGNNVELELIDANSGKGYTRTAGAVLDAYRIIMNKGSNTSSNFSMNSTYTLGGTTNTTTKALEIKNGLFIHNTGSSITLSSGGSDFNIPETGGLEIANGTMSITGTAANGILLDGLLRISGGTLTLGDNDATPANDDHYIEYSASGSATIEVSGGTLTVGSQIRRGFLSTTGILTYNQTGGTVTVGRYYAPYNDRGIFEIINTGSSFTHTAGSLTIVREQPNANVAGFIFQPQSSTATGDITIGSANTPANHIIDIDASKPIGSLIISDAPTNLTARLLVHDLTVNTNLTIGAGSTFNTNGLDLYIGGAFTNNGTFQGTGSRTTFNGSGAQVATLNAATTFDELEINKTGTLTLAGSQNPDVTTHLFLTSGTIDDGGRIINLQGNMTANATHTSTGSGRIRFNGSITQEIFGNNNGQLGSIEIDNSSGILLQTDLQINGTSTLTNGIFNIESRQLTFGVNAAIAGTPSSSRMFRNDGSLNASGYRKIVGTGASDFTIPMGTTIYYTPARFNFSSNSTQGTITIKPVTLSVNAATGGKDDVLNYHWNVTSTGFTTYTVTHEFTYDDSFVQLNDIASENDYVGGRYFNANWTTDGTVNSATNVIQFANVSYLDGLYTAGDPNEFGTIPTYYSRSGAANITTTGAPWTDVNTWSTKEWSDPDHNTSIPATPPNGNAVRIKNGHIVNVTANSQKVSSVLLEGTLDLGTTYSHILGNVSGTGTLIIGSTTVVFPSGNFDAFTGTGGGTVVYNAATDVTLPPQTTYWNLVITGSNQRTLPAVDIIVNNNLIIENTARFNANDRQIYLKGNWINNSGNATPFVPGTGTVVLNGSANQTIGGSASTTFYNLTVNNSQTGNSLTSNITIIGTMKIQSGRMNLNGQTITMGTSATLSESPGNLIYGLTGSIVATRNLGTSPGNVAGLGFNITSTAVPLGITTITRRHSQRTENGLSSIFRHYSVSPATNSGLNATVEFNYDDTEIESGDDENTFVLYRKPGAGNWTQRGGSVDAVNNTVTLTGIDAFSEWTVDEGNSLPVDLVGLSIQEIRNRPIIKWETASEYENYGFFIERRFLDDSTKADEWTELAFIEGKGTTFERQFYQFQDENVGAAGYYEYRLIQMDFDGKTKTFGPIEFFNSPPDYFMLDQNYPNPFNPVTTIPYQMAKNGKVRIDVFDVLGRRIQTLVDSEVKAGSYAVKFNASNLASGVYLVRMTTQGFTFTRKIMLVK